MSNNFVEIGETLRKKRIELGRDLPSVAEETKIFEKYLDAIENGESKEFPSLVYYKLFACSYAKELGLDPDALFAQETEPEESIKANDIPANNLPSPVAIATHNQTEEEKSKLKNIFWFLSIVLLGGAAIAIRLIKGKDSQELNQPPVNEPAVTQQEEDEAIPAFDTMAIDSGLSGNLPVQGMRLNITVRETCWMVVVADGDTLVFGNLSPGTSHDFRAINRFNISAGNPHGLEIKLNDTLLKPLSSGGLPVKNLQINRDNARAFYLLPEDSSHAGD